MLGAAVRALGRPERLGAAVGPGVGPCCYPVSAEVRETFASSFGEEVVRPPAVDLAAAARAALVAAGLAPSAVQVVEACTELRAGALLLVPARRERLRPPGGGGVGDGLMIRHERLRAVLAEVREELDAAAGVSGRPAGSVQLVLAGKYIAADETPTLIEAGVEVVGENTLQDLQARRALAGGRLTFDFIGKLQRRKVKHVMPAVRLLHSLDSEDLAAEIARRVEGPTRVLVEVNVAEEENKGGIVPARIGAFVEDVSVHPDLVIGGLMAMPPQHADAELSRPYFAAVRRQAEDLASQWSGRHDFADLSMGTSQDYVVAAEEGATMVRVGRGLLDRVRTPTPRG